MPVRKTIIRRKRKLMTPWAEVPLRSKLFCVLDRNGIPDVQLPFYAFVSRALIYRFMLFVAVAISLSIVIESLPRYAELKRPNVFSIVEMVCVLIFTVDWLLRLVSTPKPLEYVKNGLNIFDLLGLVPYWLELGGVVDAGVSKWILILRVSRLVRGLMYLKNYEILLTTIEESTEVGMLLCMIVVTLLPLFGSALYFAERGSYNEQLELWERPCAYNVECAYETSPFQTAWDGMWFTMTTITTLGFGEMYPTSDTGKIIAAIAMLAGAFVLSFPVMILAVNFEHERHKYHRSDQRHSAKEGSRLRELQTEHTHKMDKQEISAAAMEKSSKRRTSLAAAAGLMDTVPSRVEPIFFRSGTDDISRKAVMVSAVECRYDPLISLKRNPDGSIMLEQSARSPTVFYFSVILGSEQAASETRSAMNMFLPPDSPSVGRCRNFHVPEIHFALDFPLQTTCTFLRSLQLLVRGEENIEPTRKEVRGALELLNFTSELDDQTKTDFAFALQRCRLRITASVAKEDPSMYDVPVFLNILKSTNLVKALLAHKRGLVMVTEQQVTHLVNGVHHLFDLSSGTDDEFELVINVPEINRVIARAVLQTCASPCDDLTVYQETDFLYPEIDEQAKYFGVFVSRLTGIKEETTFIQTVANFFSGNIDGEEEEGLEQDQRVLCNVVVKTITPTFYHRSVVM